MPIQKKQYELLNALKIIAAFFVVCIHVQFPDSIGKSIVAVARFAVPFFFMVSGFFSYYKNKDVLGVKYKRKITHIAVLFLSALALYFISGTVIAFMNGSVNGYITGLFTTEDFLSFFFFNSVTVSDFLWFLPALIYVYVVFFLIEKTGKTNKLYFLIPVLFIAGVVLREIPEFFKNTPAILDKSYFCRNWLFLGHPFFMTGHFIRANEEKLMSKFSDASLLVIMIVSTAESVVADMIHVQKGVYIGTFFAVISLFLFALKKEGRVKTKKIAFLGAEYSLYIYILHILVRDILNKFTSAILPDSLNKAVSFLMPFIVFAVTLVISAVYVYAKKFLKSKLRREK